MNLDMSGEFRRRRIQREAYIDRIMIMKRAHAAEIREREAAIRGLAFMLVVVLTILVINIVLAVWS